MTEAKASTVYITFHLNAAAQDVMTAEARLRAAGVELAMLPHNDFSEYVGTAMEMANELAVLLNEVATLVSNGPTHS